MVILDNVVKTYRTRTGEVNALNSVNLQIKKGEFIVVHGPSGSGKTTLLMTIAGMLRPTSGIVSVEQNKLYDMNIQARAKFRADTIGFIFQMFYLVPYLDVVENVALAGRTGDKNNGKAQAAELLEQLGLTNRFTHKPSELSAGEKQRTAIARALLNRPKIILADEPTGNLDPDNTAEVLGYLAKYHKGENGTVVLVTHSREVGEFADRVVYMRDGLIDSSD